MQNRMTVKEVTEIAQPYGWNFHCFQDNIGMLSFTKIQKGVKLRVNIYLTKMTVATAMHHPKRGKTQLYRRNVSKKLLERILRDPRAHTGKGYYEKI